MQMVHNLPQQYRRDPWVLALADAILGVLEEQNAYVRSIREQVSLDTITWALEIEERQAGIIPPAGSTLEGRRSVLKAKLRSGGKLGIREIQAVADAWKNGEVEVSFPAGRISVQFVGAYGIPEDLPSLQSAIRFVIPAHLPVDYRYRYFLIADIHGVMDLSTLQLQTMDRFAFGGSL